MRFQDLHEAFREQQLTQRLAHSIRHLLNGQTVRFMEVCGGHTAAVLRFGIQALLPDSIQLLSGPGCPVCVTPQVVVRQSLEVADRDDSLLATFGDMMRVPSTDGSLEDARARGASIRVIYSPLDVLDLARENPLKKVVLLAIGFETTAPATAKLLLEAERANVKNLFVLCAHKTMPEAMSWLLEQGQTALDGFICPGHVSTIIGAKPYDLLPREHGVGCAIAGFEPLDILLAIHRLLEQKMSQTPRVDICYSRSVTLKGNVKAQAILNTVLEPCSSIWRGLGLIPNSGLRLRERFSHFDAVRMLHLQTEGYRISDGFEADCRCSEILRGLVRPTECPLFGTRCTPESPVGTCMVSPEGTCQNYYVLGSVSAD